MEYDELDRRLRATGAHVTACPCCQGELWDTGHRDEATDDPGIPNPISLEVHLPLGWTGVRGERGSLACWPLVCLNCGFVRLHSITQLDMKFRLAGD